MHNLRDATNGATLIVGEVSSLKQSLRTSPLPGLIRFGVLAAHLRVIYPPWPDAVRRALARVRPAPWSKCAPGSSAHAAAVNLLDAVAQAAAELPGFRQLQEAAAWAFTRQFDLRAALPFASQTVEHLHEEYLASGEHLTTGAAKHVLPSYEMALALRLAGKRFCSTLHAATASWPQLVQPIADRLAEFDAVEWRETIEWEIARAEFQPVVAAATTSVVAAAPVTAAPVTADLSVDERMRKMLEANPDAVQWSAKRWADEIGCVKSSVHDAPTWSTIMGTRALQKASRMNDDAHARGYRRFPKKRRGGQAG